MPRSSEGMSDLLLSPKSCACEEEFSHKSLHSHSPLLYVKQFPETAESATSICARGGEGAASVRAAPAVCTVAHGAHLRTNGP